MAFLTYTCTAAATQTTDATPSTLHDGWFHKPGTRNITLKKAWATGKAANATSLNVITFRIRKRTAAATSGGTAITPAPADPGLQASKFTAGFAASGDATVSGAVTTMNSFGCGAASTNGWMAAQDDPDRDAGPALEGSANMSLDIAHIAPVASLGYEMYTIVYE